MASEQSSRSLNLGALAARDPLADRASDSIIVFGLDRSILYWNQAAERVYGFGAKAAIGRNLDALLAQPTFEPHPAAFDAVVSTGTWQGRLRRRTQQGDDVVVHVRWVLRLDDDGEPDSIVEYGAAEASSEELAKIAYGEARYRGLFLRAPVALMLADGAGVYHMLRELRAQGVVDLDRHFDEHPEFLDHAMQVVAIAEANEKAVQLLGAASPADLIGPVRPLWEHGSATFKRALAARFDGELYFAEETKVCTYDGRVIDTVFTLAFPTPDTFEGAALMGMLDISARRQAEAQLRRVQADFAHAARVSTLGELTASIAHELRQPLAAISANGKAAIRWLDRENPELDRAKERAVRIVSDAHRADELIQRIRRMAVKHAPEASLVQLNDLIRETLLFLKHELEDKRVAVSTTLAPDLPEIQGDRIQLQQVIVNLLVNAIQAMEEAAATTRRIALDTLIDKHGHVHMRVTDSGPGIAAEHLGHVFDGFFTTKPGGMGMGLAICETIVTGHGGLIHAGNAPTGGAMMAICLPIAGQSPISPGAY